MNKPLFQALDHVNQARENLETLKTQFNHKVKGNSQLQETYLEDWNKLIDIIPLLQEISEAICQIDYPID